MRIIYNPFFFLFTLFFKMLNTKFSAQMVTAILCLFVFLYFSLNLGFNLNSFRIDVCFILRCLHSFAKKEVELIKRCLLEFVYNILASFPPSSRHQNLHLKNASNSSCEKILSNVNIIYLFSQVQVKLVRYSYKECSLFSRGQNE